MSVCVQVLLVAGGRDGDYAPISSTEVLVGDSLAWTMATPLPRAMFEMGSVSFDNTVYMTGKLYCTALYCIALYCTILQAGKVLMIQARVQALAQVQAEVQAQVQAFH